MRKQYEQNNDIVQPETSTREAFRECSRRIVSLQWLWRSRAPPTSMSDRRLANGNTKAFVKDPRYGAVLDQAKNIPDVFARRLALVANAGVKRMCDNLV